MIIELEKQAVYVIADPHRHWGELRQNIENEDVMHDCILVIAGDNKLGFDKQEVTMNQCELLNQTLAKKNIIGFMIRGNHDNPSYYDGDKINMSNLQAIPDYTILSIGDENILCVGGAISVDRVVKQNEYMRKVNCLKSIYPYEEDLEIAKSKIIRTYWTDEKPVFNITALESINSQGTKISHVITHTSPNFAYITDDTMLNKWYKNDSSLRDDIHEERKVFTNLYAWLLSHEHPLKTWTYGHFHHHNQMNMGECVFTSLHRCNEIFDYKKIIEE